MRRKSLIMFQLTNHKNDDTTSFKNGRGSKGCSMILWKIEENQVDRIMKIHRNLLRVRKCHGKHVLYDVPVFWKSWQFGDFPRNVKTTCKVKEKGGGHNSRARKYLENMLRVLRAEAWLMFHRSVGSGPRSTRDQQWDCNNGTTPLESYRGDKISLDDIRRTQRTACGTHQEYPQGATHLPLAKMLFWYCSARWSVNLVCARGFAEQEGRTSRTLNMFRFF